MNTPANDPRLFKRYLLGYLSPPQTERLDELSLTDNEFAHSLLAAHFDLIDEYVQGELSGADLKRFEASFLASALHRQSVETARSFQVFAQQITNHPLTEATHNPSRRRLWSGFVDRFGFVLLPRFAQLGFAAVALTLYVAGAWWICENVLRQQALNQSNKAAETHARLEENWHFGTKRALAAAADAGPVEAQKQQLAQDHSKAEPGDLDAQPPASGSGVVAINLAPQLRGDERVRTVLLSPAVTVVSINLWLEPDAHELYRVTLLNKANEVLWRGRNLKARRTGDSKSLTFNFSSQLLKSGFYFLQVNGAKTGSADGASCYLFKVVKE